LHSMFLDKEQIQNVFFSVQNVNLFDMNYLRNKKQKPANINVEQFQPSL
jgi:hypothetical protein